MGKHLTKGNGLVAIAVLAFVARLVVVHVGLVYGEDATRNLTLVVAGLVIAAGLTLAKTPGTTVGDALTRTSTAIGLAALAVGAVQVIAPNTPREAATRACRGTPVLGARFYAQTTGRGNNARAGVSKAYPQLGRFAPGCTVGFDGYCIGEPVADFNDVGGLPDTRWLIVHRHDWVMASARVVSQSAEQKLGDRPAARCQDDFGGLEPPSAIRLTISEPDTYGMASLRVATKNTAFVGYASHVLARPLSGDYPYQQIGLKRNPPSFKGGQWNAGVAATDLARRTGRIEVAAANCIAAGVPYGRPSIRIVTFDHGRVRDISPVGETTPKNRDLLARIACAGPS